MNEIKPVTIEGLTPYQHQICDILWTCHTLEEVEQLRQSVPPQNKIDVQICIDMVMAAVLDQVDDIQLSVKQYLKSL